MEQLIELYGKVRCARLNDAGDSICPAFTCWAQERGISLRLIQPGKLCQKARIGSSGETYGSEVLRALLSEAKEPVRKVTDSCLIEYKEWWSHDAIGRMSPPTSKP